MTCVSTHRHRFAHVFICASQSRCIKFMTEDKARWETIKQSESFTALDKSLVLEVLRVL